jgi:peptide deformylase
MAIRPIVIAGTPEGEILRRPAHRVRDVRDRAIQKLIEDMFETMRDAPGVGLAAPQVGVPLRLVVIEATEANPPLVLANPEIVKSFGRRRVTEGCLSVPGYQGELWRAEQVLVKGLDASGKEVRIKAPPNSLLSQALEHEIGHINGTLYTDLIEKPEDLYRIRARAESQR